MEWRPGYGIIGGSTMHMGRSGENAGSSTTANRPISPTSSASGSDSESSGFAVSRPQATQSDGMAWGRG